jgi:hypothetical protein
MRASHAGARERVGKRRGADATTAAAPCSRGIGFAPEMIAPIAIMPRILLFHRERKRMTAYLLSLALAGPVAIAIWGVS